MTSENDGLVELIGHDLLIQALEDWAENDSDAFMDVISGTFDASGQRASSAVPAKILDARKEESGDLHLQVQFRVTYANPVDETDSELSAENVTDHIVSLTMEGMHVRSIDHDGIDQAADGVFP